MNVTCTGCQTIFRVDPAKVPANGVRARCSVCSGVFWVRHDVAVPVPPVEAPLVGQLAPAAVVAPVAVVVPAVVVAAVSPVAPVQMPPVQPAPPRFSIPAQAPGTSAIHSAPPGATILPPPAVVPWPTGGPAVAPPARRPELQSPAAPPSFEPAVGRPAVAPPAPSKIERPAPPAAPALPSYVSAAASAPSPATSVVAAKKARINPFLSQDPAAKARRLARALISDMVVYHPAKRREGLQNSSLKRLFDEEIRKSWEEYVDQVGQDMAQSTPYFQEALNEILADGQPVFP